MRVGDFVHPGRRLCTVWGEPDPSAKAERRVNRAFAIGASRTMQQDVGFGIRQIVESLARQASLAVAGVEKGCPLPEDAAPVRDAAEVLLSTTRSRVT